MRLGTRWLWHPGAVLGVDECMVADRGLRPDCLIDDLYEFGREQSVLDCLFVKVDVQSDIICCAPNYFNAVVTRVRAVSEPQEGRPRPPPIGPPGPIRIRERGRPSGK